MAEKATLLQKLPPVAKNTSPEDSSRTEAVTEAAEATELQPESQVSITSLQAATYGSFILSFVLAGFAAVVIYRKALSKTNQAFSGSAKLLAAMLVLVCLHGFVATYVYTNYLNQQRDSAPLSLTIMVWIVFGAAIGYLGNRLIEKNAKLDTFDAVVDALTYACVYVFATFAVTDKVGANIALILALLAIIAYIIPLSRFLISCKRVKFKRQITNLHGRQFSLYSQVILPIGIPIVTLLFILELIGPEISLLSMNIFTSATVLAASAVMLVSIKRAGEQEDAIATTPTEEPEVNAAPTIDPLVTELLAEQAQIDKEAEDKLSPETDVVTAFVPPEPERPHKPRALPKQLPSVTIKEPRKPEAPKKPAKPQNREAGSTPKSAFKVKAPNKPKKRL